MPSEFQNYSPPVIICTAALITGFFKVQEKHQWVRFSSSSQNSDILNQQTVQPHGRMLHLNVLANN
jgi:hypothetical protein